MQHIITVLTFILHYLKECSVHNVLCTILESLPPPPFWRTLTQSDLGHSVQTTGASVCVGGGGGIVFIKLLKIAAFI